MDAYLLPFRLRHSDSHMVCGSLECDFTPSYLDMQPTRAVANSSFAYAQCCYYKYFAAVCGLPPWEHLLEVMHGFVYNEFKSQCAEKKHQKGTTHFSAMRVVCLPVLRRNASPRIRRRRNHLPRMVLRYDINNQSIQAIKICTLCSVILRKRRRPSRMMLNST